MTKAQRQTVFNKVYRHLLTQGERALNPNGPGCAYRGRRGTMCAVGCLIANDLYSRRLEGLAADNELIRNVLEGSLGVEISDTDAELLRDLQRIHDLNVIDDFRHEPDVTPERWPEYLYAAAQAYDLEVPTL